MKKSKVTSTISLLLCTGLCISLLASCSSDTGDSDVTNTSSDGTVYVMKLTTQDNENSVAGEFIQTWADAVEEETDGRVEVDIYWGATLVSASESYSAVLDGIADATWCGPGFVSGMFPLSEVMALPYNGITSGIQGSACAWDLVTQNEAVAAEWEDFYLVAFHSLGAVPIASSTPISSVEDLEGLRFRNGYSAVIDWLGQLGAIGQTFANSDIYENISKGVVDGCLNDYQVIDQYSIYEVLDTIIDCSVNYSCMSLVISLDFYDSLPSDLQEIFDSKLSGKEWGITAGTFWRESDDELRQEMIDAGVNVIYPDKEMYEVFVAAGEVACQNWIDSVGGEAQNVYDQLQEIIAGYGDEYDEYLPSWYADVVG